MKYIDFKDEAPEPEAVVTAHCKPSKMKLCAPKPSPSTLAVQTQGPCSSEVGRRSDHGEIRPPTSYESLLVERCAVTTVMDLALMADCDALKSDGSCREP